MKKGFTLVELLAVIVVLSVILLIAGKSVLGTMNKSRTQLNNVAKKNLEDAAISYAINNFSIPGKTNYITDKCAKDHEVTRQEDNCIKTVTVQQLIDDGYFSDNNSNCKKNITLLVYKYKNGKQIDFKAYVPDDVCS